MVLDENNQFVPMTAKQAEGPKYQEQIEALQDNLALANEQIQLKNIQIEQLKEQPCTNCAVVSASRDKKIEDLMLEVEIKGNKISVLEKKVEEAVMSKNKKK